MATTKIKKFTCLSDARNRASAGEEAAQKCLIGCLQNFGCDHLMGNPKYYETKWQQAYAGLMAYIDALVGEYGETEAKAFKEVLAELNAARNYSDDIVLV